MDKLNNEVKKKNRERAENWTREEKELLIEIMRQSAPIIENKQTDTNTNKKKIAEWIKIQSKLRELTGKSRDIPQIKGFWRRTKMAAKKNVSEHRRAIRCTGGGLPPPSPHKEDLTVMDLCPTDFIDERNQFDCDGPLQNADHIEVIEDEAQLNSTIYDIELNESIIIESEPAEPLMNEVITVADVHDNEVQIENQQNEKKIVKKNNHKIKVYPDKSKHCKNESSHKGVLISSNTNFKNRSLLLMEEEHELKMKYHRQEKVHQELRHKIEIEILLLKKNNLLLEQEKKELEIKLLKSKTLD